MGLTLYWEPTAHISSALHGWYNTIAPHCPPESFLHTYYKFSDTLSSTSVLIINHTSEEMTTFMSKTFEESHIIQPQHLADVHAIRKNGQFIRHIFEEKIVFPKTWWVEDLEALPLTSSLAKLLLKHHKEFWIWMSNKAWKDNTTTLPAWSLETCEQTCESWLWWPRPLLDHDPDYSFCSGWEELVCHQYKVAWTHHSHSLGE